MEILNIFSIFSGLPLKMLSMYVQTSAVPGTFAFLPAGLAAKVRVGEESGEVGSMLTRCAENIEEGTRRKIKRLLSLFEPLVIVFLALMVLVVVVSIFMAIMEINQIE